jgi:hypothetical protein
MSCHKNASMSKDCSLLWEEPALHTGAVKYQVFDERVYYDKVKHDSERHGKKTYCYECMHPRGQLQVLVCDTRNGYFVCIHLLPSNVLPMILGAINMQVAQMGLSMSQNL